MGVVRGDLCLLGVELEHLLCLGESTEDAFVGCAQTAAVVVVICKLGRGKSSCVRGKQSAQSLQLISPEEFFLLRNKAGFSAVFQLVFHLCKCKEELQ